jgi:hypothetical protein
MPRLANLDAPGKIADYAAEMLEQPRFLIVDPCNKRIVVGLAAASPAGRQRSEGFQFAIAQLAP